MMKWRPISTAPTNVSVLIDADEGVIEAFLENGEWKPIVLDYHGCGCCGGLNPKPTHWMPLPEPPSV